jgi:hypothetical protein
MWHILCMVPTLKTKVFPLNSILDGVVAFYLCCDDGSPDGRDVQAGLADRMVYQRHVGCVRFNL